MHAPRRFIPALTVTAVVAVLDGLLSDSAILLPLLLCGPLVAAATCPAACTAAMAALATGLAIALGAANHNFGSSEHVAAILAVAAGGTLATLVAHVRERERERRVRAERDAARADLVARVTELFEQGADPLERLADLVAMTVPDHADLCIADVRDRDGPPRAAALAARDPRDAEALRAARELQPIDLDGPHPVARVLRGEPPVMLEAMTEADHRHWAAGPEHLDLMRRLDYRSAIVVPLTARGRTIGALSLLRYAERGAYEWADLDTVSDVARRAGLAIDHARLFGRLTQTERELETVLGALAEAVTVQEPGGQVVYANEAAAELMGFDTIEGLLSAPLEDYWQGWDVCDEQGDTIARERLPGRRALAGDARPEPLLMQAVRHACGTRRWLVVKASPVLDGDGRPRLAVNVIEDVTVARRREFEQGFLAEASRLLSSSLDTAETLERVAAAAIPTLADWCAVDMPDERGRLRRVATADRSAERTRVPQLVLGGPGSETLPLGPPHVLRTGRSELYPELDDAVLRAVSRSPEQLEWLRAVGPRSALIVPMVAGDHVIGTIMMGTVESRRRLDEADRALAEELGRRAGLAVEHSRVHGERSEIATTLQDALLPPRLPSIAGLSVAARFRAAGEASRVGGDFYDIFPVGSDPTHPDAPWMLVIGDVTGKGPAAAAITSLARYTMRTAAFYEDRPCRVLERLNHVLAHDDDRRRLCTAVCARVDRADGRITVTVAAAGHPPPLVASTDGAVRPIGEPGTLLGAFPAGEWSDTSVELREGETLVLYTDGVPDTRGPEGRFGGARLLELARELVGRPAAAFAGGLDDALLAFQAGEQRDDVALLVVQPTPGYAPALVTGTPRSASVAI